MPGLCCDAINKKYADVFVRVFFLSFIDTTKKKLRVYYTRNISSLRLVRLDFVAPSDIFAGFDTAVRVLLSVVDEPGVPDLASGGKSSPDSHFPRSRRGFTVTSCVFGQWYDHITSTFLCFCL